MKMQFPEVRLIQYDCGKDKAIFDFNIIIWEASRKTSENNKRPRSKQQSSVAQKEYQIKDKPLT